MVSKCLVKATSHWLVWQKKLRFRSCLHHIRSTKPLSNQRQRLHRRKPPPGLPERDFSTLSPNGQRTARSCLLNALRAQRLWPHSRWLMEAQRKGPLRNRKTLKERSAQKDSRLTIGWLNAKLRASDKELWVHAPMKKLLWRPNIHVLKQIHTQAPWTPAKRNLIHTTEGGRLFDSGSWGGYGVPGWTNLWWPQCWSMWLTVKKKKAILQD